MSLECWVFFVSSWVSYVVAMTCHGVITTCVVECWTIVVDVEQPRVLIIHNAHVVWSTFNSDKYDLMKCIIPLGNCSVSECVWGHHVNLSGNWAGRVVSIYAHRHVLNNAQKLYWCWMFGSEGELFLNQDVVLLGVFIDRFEQEFLKNLLHGTK